MTTRRNRSTRSTGSDSVASSSRSRAAARRRHPSAGGDAGGLATRGVIDLRDDGGGRTLALLDVENLLPGDPADALAGDYRRSMAEAAALAQLTSGDHAVLAVGSNNHPGLFACASTWPGAAVRCRGGLDGADRALTEHVADVAAVARAFDQVVIGSGDHHFIACVRALRARGVRTTVVSRADKLSSQLRRVADRVLLLPAGPAAPPSSVPVLLV
jgi:hypothetical protein